MTFFQDFLCGKKKIKKKTAKSEKKRQNITCLTVKDLKKVVKYYLKNTQIIFLNGNNAKNNLQMSFNNLKSTGIKGFQWVFNWIF